MKSTKTMPIWHILMQWEVILFFMLVVVIVVNSSLSPYFLDLNNILRTTFNFTEKAIIVLPMMFIIICADIDISVAGIIALSSCFMGLASQHLGIMRKVLSLREKTLHPYAKRLIQWYGIPPHSATTPTGDSPVHHGRGNAMIGVELIIDFQETTLPGESTEPSNVSI